MSSDIYCLGLSSPLLPNGYGSSIGEWWICIAALGLFCIPRGAFSFSMWSKVFFCGQVFCLAPVWGQKNIYFFHWVDSSLPESLFLKRCSLHLPVKLRPLSTYIFFSFWLRNLPLQLEVHWSISQSAVPSYAIFTPVSPLLAFPLSELPYIYVSLSVFQTFLL